MIWLDTSACIWILRGTVPAALVARLAADRTALSAIVLTELYNGAFRTGDPTAELRKISLFATGSTVAPFDEQAARFAGQVMAELRVTGRNIEFPDILIGAHALSRGGTVLTANPEHFRRIPDLAVESWAG